MTSTDRETLVLDLNTRYLKKYLEEDKDSNKDYLDTIERKIRGDDTITFNAIIKALENDSEINKIPKNIIPETQPALHASDASPDASPTSGEASELNIETKNLIDELFKEKFKADKMAAGKERNEIYDTVKRLAYDLKTKSGFNISGHNETIPEDIKKYLLKLLTQACCNKDFSTYKSLYYYFNSRDFRKN